MSTKDNIKYVFQRFQLLLQFEDEYQFHLWISDSGLSPLDTGHWTLASGLWTFVAS